MIKDIEKICVGWRYFGLDEPPSSSIIGSEIITEILKNGIKDKIKSLGGSLV